MKDRVRLAMLAAPSTVAPAFAELREAVSNEIILEPLFVPSYVALLSAVEQDPELFAWASPLVALDLVRGQFAVPLVAVNRRGKTNYYAALVSHATKGIAHLGHLRGRRVGWVSKLSAAGYVVPRLYLQSLGLDVPTLFSGERFSGSHARSAMALIAGSVDVIATYAHLDPALSGFTLPTALAGARLLATAGPIPGDVVLCGSSIDDATRIRVTAALLSTKFAPNGALARLMSIDHFEPTTALHFEPLRRWTQHALDEALRPFAGPVHHVASVLHQ
jgi:ABC-type phosphate/phosphonate transport system substrate-binding protein